MALVAASSARPKPEFNLILALDEYKKILPDEDKQRLEAGGSPAASAAINLATMIDSECTVRRRHCMGQRLITFLDSIQQFAGIIDTFVGSNPERAALVWGGVKLTLLVRHIKRA